jgi:hypothetical protein
MPKTNEEKIIDLGWVDDSEICIFPDEVLAVCLGWKSPGLPITFFTKATETQISEAISKGWIKFIDGNGESMTKAQYEAKYPDYPDPEFQLRLSGRFPPVLRTFIKLGRKP